MFMAGIIRSKLELIDAFLASAQCVQCALRVLLLLLLLLQLLHSSVVAGPFPHSRVGRLKGVCPYASGASSVAT